MATIVDRDRTVRLLGEEFAALDELYSGLADEDWERPTCLPGWTVRDQLTHLLAPRRRCWARRPPRPTSPGTTTCATPSPR